MVTSRRIHWLDRSYLDDRFRRVSPVAAHSGDRLLSEPTAGIQFGRREPLFICHNRLFANGVGSGCEPGVYLWAPPNHTTLPN